jgi:PTH1 family peptidyl-tRNA hydrolase
VKLIVGLGNPGFRYRETRHNVGFRVIDALARRHGLEFESGPADALLARWRDEHDVWLAKPLTFMNESGRAVADLVRFYRIAPADLLVIVDDVNLPLGRLRARAGGSAGGHNGLKSVIAHVGGESFSRLRVGVGRGESERDLTGHVLGRPGPDERALIDAAVERAAAAAETFVTGGIDAVMREFNRAGPSEGEAETDS